MVAPAAEEHPTGAKPTRAVHLGEAAEGGAEGVFAERRRRRVHGVVVEDTVVDLVGEDGDLMLLCQADEAFDHVSRIDGAGRIVRIDQY